MISYAHVLECLRKEPFVALKKVCWSPEGAAYWEGVRNRIDDHAGFLREALNNTAIRDSVLDSLPVSDEVKLLTLLAYGFVGIEKPVEHGGLGFYDFKNDKFSICLATTSPRISSILGYAVTSFAKNPELIKQIRDAAKGLSNEQWADSLKMVWKNPGFAESIKWKKEAHGEKFSEFTKNVLSDENCDWAKEFVKQSLKVDKGKTGDGILEVVDRYGQKLSINLNTNPVSDDNVLFNGTTKGGQYLNDFCWNMDSRLVDLSKTFNPSNLYDSSVIQKASPVMREFLTKGIEQKGLLLSGTPADPFVVAESCEVITQLISAL